MNDTTLTCLTEIEGSHQAESRLDAVDLYFLGHRKVTYLWCLLGSLLIAAFEVFTPVAPLQRLAGLVIVVTPDNYKERLLGSKTVARLQHIKETIARYQQTVTVTDRNGSTIVHPSVGNHPAYLKHVLVTVENHRYFQTFVIDWLRLGRVLVDNVRTGSITAGASGLAQQAARSIVLKDQTRTLSRKIAELAVALELRTRYSADEIVDFYLSSAFLGRDVHGFYEASRVYLGKPLDDLSIQEMVVLVGMLDRPNAYLGNPDLLRARYEGLVAYLKVEGVLTPEQAHELAANVPPLARDKRDVEENHWASVAHYARAVQARAQDATSIQALVDTELSRVGYRALNRALNMLSQRTGIDDLDGFLIAGYRSEILTLIGSRHDWHADHTSRVGAWRPGSLLKLFLYAGFFELGGRPDMLLPVRPVTWELPHGTWKVHNYTDRYDAFDDGLPAAFCLSRSLNVPASLLAQTEVGTLVFEKLAGAGIDMPHYPANLLGAEALEPLILFQALQAFVAPFGQVPERMRMSTSDPRPEFLDLFPSVAVHNVALAMGLAIDDSLGTGSYARQFGWDGDHLRLKTGTGSDHTSAAIFVVLPSGFTALMGVFSRSGGSMYYENQRSGASGATLLPYMNDVLESRAARSYVQRRSFEDLPEEYLWLESPAWMQYHRVAYVE